MPFYKTVKLCTLEEIAELKAHIDARAKAPLTIVGIRGGGTSSLATALDVWSKPRFDTQRAQARRRRSTLTREQKAARDAGTDDRVEVL